MEKNAMLHKIEKEILPMLSNWINTEKKFDKVTSKNFQEIIEIELEKEKDPNGNVVVKSRKLVIKAKYIHPASEEEFEAIGNVLLYITQNPSSRMINDIINSVGFEEMLNNISEFLG